MTVRRTRLLLAVAALAALAVCVGPAQSAFPGENGKIVFESNTDGNNWDEISTVNPDGTELTRLTSSTDDDMDPTWSPDGTKIAFARADTTGGFSGPSDVFVMDADGDNETNLTNTPASYNRDPAWSPDGNTIAYRGPGMNGTDIWRMDADGSNRVNLTNTDDYEEERGPIWSPDGTKIAYSAMVRDATGTIAGSAVFVMNADGTDLQNLTGGLVDAHPSWSPDGTQIAFTSRRDGNDEIYSMEADGANPTRLTNDTAEDSFPAWSPDGSKIVFQSDRGGPFSVALYVMSSSGGAPDPLGAEGSSPDWQSLGGFTSIGTNVVVGPVDATSGDVPLRVRFSTVTSTGFTALRTSASGPAPPPGFVVAGVYYELTTTATFDQAEVCFAIVPPSAPTIAHWTGNPPVLSTPATYYLNTAGTIVPAGLGEFACAIVMSFSPFALLEPDEAGDTTPPALSLPLDIAVDATSPVGAVVSYSATATDGVDPSPGVSCSPSSGSTFAIGTTGVQCTATDDAGNSSSGSFSVTVRGAKEQLNRLIQKVVDSSNLSPALKAQLTGRLQALVAGFDPGNAQQRRAVCVALNVFKGVVHTLSGRGITPAQAAEWIADANRIRTVLAC